MRSPKLKNLHQSIKKIININLKYTGVGLWFVEVTMFPHDTLKITLSYLMEVYSLQRLQQSYFRDSLTTSGYCGKNHNTAVWLSSDRSELL